MLTLNLMEQAWGGKKRDSSRGKLAHLMHWQWELDEIYLHAMKGDAAEMLHEKMGYQDVEVPCRPYKTEILPNSLLHKGLTTFRVFQG